MSVPTQDFIWQQGEDGEISLIYKDTQGVGIDLAGYELRMDVVDNTGAILYTFNTVNADPSDPEATLNNAATQGAIYINVPRTESLAAGALYNHLNTALDYDIFLRDTSDRQKKILKGTVIVEKSHTLWP